MNLALDKLIADTPVYVRPKPPLEIKEGCFLLENLNSNTIAKAFILEKKEKGVSYHYQPKDGFTREENGQHKQEDAKHEVMPEVALFAGRCVTQRDKSVVPYAPTDSKDKSILSQLSYQPEVRLRMDQAAPCWLKDSADPTKIIAFKNGLLDWSVYPYKFHEPSPDFYTINYLPFEWYCEVGSELLASYLRESLDKNIEMHDLLMMFAGYTLGFRDGKKKFMILKGEADTGKSIYADILTHLLGGHNISTVPLVNFVDPHLMWESYGKMLNISDENEAMLKSKGVELVLKHYTGGTLYQFKKMYHVPFSAYPTAKILIATNHLPRFTDTSEGIWTRMLLAPFDRVFVEGKDMDKTLGPRLLATEMPAVLTWALQGARMLEENKCEFIMPKRSEEAISQYRHKVLPELEFYQENFEECDVFDGTLALSCLVFRNAYERWCKRLGIKAKSMRNLTETMVKIFPKYLRKQKRMGDKRPYYYFGIKMSVDSEFHGNESLENE